MSSLLTGEPQLSVCLLIDLLLACKQYDNKHDIADSPAKPEQPQPDNIGKSKCVHAIVGKLEAGEAELNEDVNYEQDVVELYPKHVHHKVPVCDLHHHEDAEEKHHQMIECIHNVAGQESSPLMGPPCCVESLTDLKLCSDSQ